MAGSETADPTKGAPGALRKLVNISLFPDEGASNEIEHDLNN
jgi:hypothetical protein